MNGSRRYQLVTKPEHHQELREIVEKLPPAIIAYKQPITAAEIEAVRAVRNRQRLHNLLKRKIIALAAGPKHGSSRYSTRP